MENNNIIYLPTWTKCGNLIVGNVGTFGEEHLVLDKAAASYLLIKIWEYLELDKIENEQTNK